MKNRNRMKIKSTKDQHKHKMNYKETKKTQFCLIKQRDIQKVHKQ